MEETSAKDETGNFYTSTRFGKGRKIALDQKLPRPRNIAEAKRLIDDVFKSQPLGGWTLQERRQYFSLIGVAGDTAPEDVRRIIADLEKDRLILFQN